MYVCVSANLPVPIILIIRRSTQRSPDAGVDVRIILEQALLGSVVEVRAVVDAGDLGGRPAKDLWLPGVEVAVEMDDGHGPVLTVDGPQQGQRYGVVPAQGDDPGQRPAPLGRADLVGGGGRRAGEDAVMAFFNLVECPGVVVPRGWTRVSALRCPGVVSACLLRK